MVLPPVGPEPTDQRALDAASGSVFTSHPKGRWMPKWGPGGFSPADIIIFAIIALVILVIAALVILK